MNRPLRLVFLTGFALLCAACTSEGAPSTFEDQNNRVERQFVTACINAHDEEEQDDADDYCECAFRTAAADLGFDEFIAVEDALQENPESLSQELRLLFEGIELPCAV